ncbi:MAG: glycosyltransferase family 39 protein [Candidatus Korobacteraceae bacterium]
MLKGRSAPRVALGSVIALAAVLRLMDLGAKSVWSDEAFSIFLAKQSWFNFWHIVTSAEANMSLYYLLLRGWIGFSDAAWWVRLLSALMGVATVPVVYWLGKEMFSQRTGLLAALLLAINLFHIRYAQEARSYSLLVLLVSISFLAFLHCLKQRSRFWSACYLLSTAFALYAHFFAALVVLVQLVLLAMVPADRRRFAIRQALQLGIVIALGLPLLWFVVFRDRGQLAWAPPVHWRDVYDVFRFLVGSGLKLGIAIVAFAIALTAWVGRFREKHWTVERWSVLVLLLWLFLPIFITLLASVWKPMYAPRFLTFCLPAALLLIAEGIAEIRFAWIRYALVLALVVGEIGPIRFYYREAGQEDWKSAVAFLGKNAHAGDAAVLPNPYCELPFQYELAHARFAVPDLRIISWSASEPPQANGPDHLWMVTCSATKDLKTQPMIGEYKVQEERDFKGVRITQVIR